MHALRNPLAYFFLFMIALRHILRSGYRYVTLFILYLSKERTRYYSYEHIRLACYQYNHRRWNLNVYGYYSRMTTHASTANKVCQLNTTKYFFQELVCFNDTINTIQADLQHNVACTTIPTTWSVCIHTHTHTHTHTEFGLLMMLNLPMGVRETVIIGVADTHYNLEIMWLL